MGYVHTPASTLYTCDICTKVEEMQGSPVERSGFVRVPMCWGHLVLASRTDTPSRTFGRLVEMILCPACVSTVSLGVDKLIEEIKGKEM